MAMWRAILERVGRWMSWGPPVAEKEALSASSLRNPLLESLRLQVVEYRIAESAPVDMVTVLGIGLARVTVLAAVEVCRKNGLSEQEILAVLGKDIDLAESESAIRTTPAVQQ